MSTSQLQNPRAAWFTGAPLSKAIALSTAVGYVVAETNKWHEALILDTAKIFDQAQFYRLFVFNWTFASMGELVFGLMALCPLMRRFEREMGSRRFSAFMVYASVLSTIFELIIFNLFIDIERYSGPYPQLGAVLALYHKFTPRLYPKFFGVLGQDFSEKSLTYGLCTQVFLCGGPSTAVPAAVGFLAGSLSLKLSETQLPELAYSLGRSVGNVFVDEVPAVMMSREVQRPPPPPPEEAVAQLTGMGFERQAVVRALQQTDNNVEAAANRLLMG